MGYAIAAFALAVAFHPPLMSRTPELAICTPAPTEGPVCEASETIPVAVRSEPLKSLAALFPFDSSAPCPGGIPFFPGPEEARQALPRCAAYVAAQPPGSRALATALAQQGFLQFSARVFSSVPQAREEALATLERALAIDPDNLVALLSKVKILQVSGSNADVSADVEHLKALYPDDPRVRMQYADLMMNMGASEQALAAIDSALELLPDEDLLHGQRAERLTRLGRTDEALAELDLAIDLRPVNAYAVFRRAELELARDNARAALADADRAKTLHYDFAEVDFMIAQANLILGNLDKALEAITNAEAHFVPQSGSRPFALYRFSILDRLGRKIEAEEALAGFTKETAGHILKVQVFLRNMGFEDVQISGNFDEITKRRLGACLLKGACTETLSRKL